LLPALTPSGTAQIKGKVTSAATTEPLEGIEVCASDEAVFECRETGATGEYDISGLPAGSYVVSFAVPFERHLNYLYQYYNDKTSAAEATPVVLATGAMAAGINAALHSGGQITGKVTDAVTKAAVEGIEVCATRRGSGEFVEGCAPSNASGEYDVVGLFSGEYTVSFRLPYESNLNYLTQYYNGKAAAGEADPVAVTAGSTTPNINAALNKGGQISGKVTDASTKAAVAEIQVCAYDGPEGSGRCSKTNGSGEYDIGGLATGEYRVEFLPPSGSNLNYLRQYYNGKASSGEAEPVSVTVGSSTPNINAALPPGGKITGKVTAAASKEALSEVQVCASENGGEFFNACAQTNVNGEYTLQGLPTGHYTVVFSSFSGPYAAQYYNNKISVSEAEAVSVTAGATTPSVNAAMQLGAEITGKVTDASTKAPVAGIQVCPQAAGAYVGTGCVSTDENGNYALTKLPATEYRIEFAPYYNSNLNYLRQYYNGKPSSAEANLVSVTPGSKTPEINAALRPGGEITGSVSAAVSKAKLANIYVCADESGGEFINHCTQTNEHGEYTVGGLPSGNYTVSFSSFTGEYAPQYYNGVPQSFEATLVVAVAGSATPNINAALAVAAEIKGSVTDAVTKAHLATIDVCALVAATDTVARCEYTNSNGEYTLRPLAAGEYKVQFAPTFGSTANYTTQYYNDKPTFAAGEVVTLAAGGGATNINLDLSASV
jgi:Carboxypeptidase regulatory-like domain